MVYTNSPLLETALLVVQVTLSYLRVAEHGRVDSDCGSGYSATLENTDGKRGSVSSVRPRSFYRLEIQKWLSVEVFSALVRVPE
jgi:hypothetical protein